MKRGELEELSISSGVICKFNNFVGMNEVPVVNKFIHSMN